MLNNSTEITMKLLEELVKEMGVVKIILDYKKQMESVYCIICAKACEEHECSRCCSCNKWCCYDHQMQHETNCDFD